MIKPLICMIAAMDKNRVIGNGDKLPTWDVPEDLARVKETTKGAPLIMGRATFESIHGYRKSDPQSGPAWPNRLNIVVTHNAHYFPNGAPDNVMVAPSPTDGLNLAYDFATSKSIGKIFVFGGQAIYEALLNDAQRLYLTEIEGEFNGDAYFPNFNQGLWTRASHEPLVSKGKDNQKFAFNVYDRIKG